MYIIYYKDTNFKNTANYKNKTFNSDKASH